MLGVFPQWDTECEQILQASIFQLADQEEPSGHVVLILDKVDIKFCSVTCTTF